MCIPLNAYWIRSLAFTQQLAARWANLRDGHFAETGAENGENSITTNLSRACKHDTRYTLVIRLTSPDQNFPMLLAHQPAGAVAREVIENIVTKRVL